MSWMRQQQCRLEESRTWKYTETQITLRRGMLRHRNKKHLIDICSYTIKKRDYIQLGQRQNKQDTHVQDFPVCRKDLRRRIELYCKVYSNNKLTSRPGRNLTIGTVSRSAIQALGKIYTRNPLIKKIKAKLTGSGRNARVRLECLRIIQNTYNNLEWVSACCPTRRVFENKNTQNLQMVEESE